MNVIADTNIIISALISPKGKESDIILNPAYDFRKYTCNFLFDEMKGLPARGFKNILTTADIFKTKI
jgi:predicted nucleic acid-binding protein